MRIFRSAVLLLIPVALLLWVRHDSSVAQDPVPQAPANLNARQYHLVSGPFAADEKDDEKRERRPLSEFMEQKLNASSMILRGLMVDDMEMVENHADQLLKMSHEEKWRASNDMMYLQHSTQFRHAVDSLREKAGKKSIDGASLAWVNVTMSCIQCHQWVRNMVLADLDEPVQ